jgi:peptide-methionine (S)-S-oxide reductase
MFKTPKLSRHVTKPSPQQQKSISIKKPKNSTKIQPKTTKISSHFSLPKITPASTSSALFKTPSAPLSNPSRQMSTEIPKPDSKTPQKAVFCGGFGCFWGISHYFGKKFPHAILENKVGFMGGVVPNPSYRDVCDTDTGHVEVTNIIYDQNLVSYEDLVKFAFTIHDPTTADRQGGDIGTQYASVIFYANDEQKKIAQGVIEGLQKALDENRIKFKKSPWVGKSIVTKLKPLEKFYSAEDYHQDYLTKNPNGYCNHSVRFSFDDL